VSRPWIVALALMLIVEGIIPFLFPRQWRDHLKRMVSFADG
jgi:uncharacterized protein